MKTNLLLLHGALGAEDQLYPLITAIAQTPELDLNTHTLNFEGHGGLPLPEHFQIERFAQNIINYLHNNNLHEQPIAFFGYSMGGYVALYLARHYPHYVAKIMTLGTKLAWSVPTAEKEVQMLNPQVIAAKLPDFAAQLQQRHAPNDWTEVMRYTRNLLLNLGHSPTLSASDWSLIKCPVCLGVGDRDNMVTMQETIEVYKQLPKGSCWVLPNTKHPIETLNLTRWRNELAFFLKT